MKNEFNHPFFTDTDRYMKRQGIKMIILSVVFVLGFSFLIDQFFKSIKDKKDSYSKNIGRRIILNKDTVQILDYSTLKGNYSLSNGQEISFELLEKTPILPD